MVEDYLLDMEDSSGPMWLQAWRCMNCGNVFDSVLEQNRLTHRTQAASGSETISLPIVGVMETGMETTTSLVA
jgi:hypothetical protein